MLAIAVVALFVSLLALPFTAWAAHAAARQAKAAHVQTAIQRDQVAAAREQTELQLRLAREALQPYVWADIQPDMQQGTVLQVAVGNSGPTVARNVKVTFDPPLPAGKQQATQVEEVQRTLATGLRSIAPSRVLRWTLGAGFDLMPTDESQLRTVRVEADGPYGPLQIFEVEIDIAEWRRARDAPDGSLHHVRGAIRDLTKAVGGVEKTMARAMDRLKAPGPEVIGVEEFADSFKRQVLPRPSEEAKSDEGQR